MRPTSHEIRHSVLKWLLLMAALLLLAWAPFPLGSNRDWSVALLAIGSAALLLQSVPAFWGELHRYLKHLKVPAIAMAIVVLFIQVQAIFRIGDLDALLHAELALFAALSVFYVSFMMAAANAKFARALSYGFVLITTAVALYGMIEVAQPERTLLWYDQIHLEGIPDGTFVNRNTFANYAGMGLIVAFSLLLANPSVQSFTRLHANLAHKDRSSNETALALLLVGAIIVLGSALLGTESRGGSLATGLGVAVYLLLWLFREPVGARPMILIGTMVLVGSGILLLIAGGGFLERLFNAGIDDSRGPLLVATLEMIWASPLLGHGFGGWETAFPAFRPEVLRPFPDFDAAHNGFLEVLSDLGLVFGLIFLSVYGWIAVKCWRGIHERHRARHYARTGLALLVFMGAHSMVDFSIQVPAVSFSFAALMGVSVAQALPRSVRRG